MSCREEDEDVSGVSAEAVKAFNDFVDKCYAPKTAIASVSPMPGKALIATRSCRPRTPVVPRPSIPPVAKPRRYTSKFFGTKKAKTEARRTDVEVKYKVYQDSAVRRKKDFVLTPEEACALFISDCFYCKKVPDERRLNGIDRVDNDRGYYPDNVVACCTSCNMMKGTMQRSRFVKACMDVAGALHNKIVRA